jgi:hypothetical protein
MGLRDRGAPGHALRMVALFIAQQLGETTHRRCALREARKPPRTERPCVRDRRCPAAATPANRFKAHAAILIHRARTIFPSLAVIDGNLRSSMPACLSGRVRMSILKP